MQKKKGEARSFFPKNSRAQGLSTNAIILIILGVIILVLLIVGFTFGWNTLLPWLKQNNVETIVQQCNAACVTGSKYDFCSNVRILKDGDTEIESSCATFAVISEYSKYGVETCSAISCDFECTDIMEIGEIYGGEDGKELVEGACPENYDDVTLIAKVEAGQKCCVPKVSQ